MARMRSTQFPFIFGFILLFFVTQSGSLLADCSFEKLPSSGFSIVCSENITEEISGTDQADIILFLPHASLVYPLVDTGDGYSMATVVGIAGLGGDDQIINAGTLVDLLAVAESAAESISLTIDSYFVGDATHSVVSDTSSTADATALGIDGGSENDWVDNLADVTADVEAIVQSAGVMVDITVTADGAVTDAGVNNASVAARSEAIGLTGSAGNDTIINAGEIDLYSNSEAEAVGVALAVAGRVEGNISGAPLSDTGVSTNAFAVGIVGGSGIDEISNNGVITADVDSSARAVGVSVDIGITEAGNISGSALNDTNVSAQATSLGIDGGENIDIIDNQGDVDLKADADALGVAVALTIAGSAEGIAEGNSMIDASVISNAMVIGINGGTGDDLIVSDGQEILADVHSTATAVSVGLGLSGNLEGNVAGKVLSDGSATADAMAIGVDGGAGQDSIDNWARIYEDVDADASTVAVSGDVAITIEEGGNASGAALSDASVIANAAATGIDGGNDADAIDNRGDIELLSNSEAMGVAVSLAVAGTMKGDAENSSVSDASVKATSMATGIEGGEGDDRIANEGMITLMNGEGDDRIDAQATAVSVALDIAGSMEGDVDGGALSDSSSEASAEAIGVSGGLGRDTITNYGDIFAGVDTGTTAVGVSVDIGLTGEGLAEGAALSNASVLAQGLATGIDGGNAADAIDNRGAIALLSSAEATGVAVALNIAGSMKGDAFGKAVSDASVASGAMATGIAGGEGNDTIDSDGSDIFADVDASATAVNVGLTVSGSMEGHVAGEALTDGSATAKASAAGIDGGLGIDTISNRANIFENVTAAASTVAVSGDVAITIEEGGNASGAALSDASVTATASATGIDGGDNSDDIDNRGDIELLSNTAASGVAVALTVAGTMKGDAEGSSASDASVMAASTAIGIDGGEGDDAINNEGIITLMNGVGDNEIDADATAVSVALTVSGSMEGNVEGEALSDSSATADAMAIAIDGGSGADEITNRGAIIGNVDTGAKAVGVGLDVSLIIAKEDDAEGNVSGVALSDASVTAWSLAGGIDGGEGTDKIDNRGDISLSTVADATGVAASLAVAGSVACKGGVEGDISGKAFSDTSTAAYAETTGIDGGGDDDQIINTGNFSLLQAQSTATGVSAALNISAGIAANGDAKVNVEGAAVGDSTVISQALVLGLAGGLGHDEITNGGGLRLLSSSDATGVSATLNVTGALSYKGTTSADISGSAMSNSSVSAIAEATGISGGWGQDTITNSGNITLMDDDIFDADAFGLSASLNISGNVAVKGVATGAVEGTAASNATVTAEATATGIDGGGDDDSIDNYGSINLLPASTADGISASLNVSGNMVGESEGTSMSNASVTALSTATGITGGAGEDMISNAGTITLMKQDEGEEEVDAEALGVAASLDISGNLNGTAEGQALAKATTTATATATGIDGADGVDSITNSAGISADVDSNAEGVAVAAGVTFTVNGSAEGSSLSDVSTAAHSATVGIAAGDDDDSIDNSGEMQLFADATASSTAVSVTIAGSMRGKAGGEALSKATTTADATATGISGGTGSDDIINLGAISANSNATTDTVAVSVGITVAESGMAEGAAVSDSSSASLARTIGIDGGGDDDTIDNKGAINVRSVSDADATAVSVGLTGAMKGMAEGKAVADSSAEATSQSIGIYGDSGDDDLLSSTNRITTHSQAAADAESVAIQLGGSVGVASNSAVADSSATSLAYSAGLDGGAGADSIDNTSEIEATVKTDATASSTSVTATIAVGSAETIGTGDSSATARSQVAAIAGGSEDDKITNSAAINVGSLDNTGAMANAQAAATTVTVGLAVGANLSESSSNAAAIAEVNAFGISGGSGNDTIDNTGDITVAPDSQGSGIMANASAESTTVDVSITVGASLGESSSDTSSTAVVNLAGISGGSGNDSIDNSGAITTGIDPDEATAAMATATAGSETFSVGLSVGGSFKDASSNASATAYSKSIGIETGLGDDSVNNRGDINTFSSSAALGSAEAMKVSMTIGALEGAVTSDASSLSTALATGISSGEDADMIDSGIERGEDGAIIDIGRHFVVNARSISVTTSNAEDLNILSIGSAIQSATANSSSTAEALARGIDGGSGGDAITVAGNYEVSADTLVGSTSRSSTIAGLSIGANQQKAQSLAETTSQASAIGIDGGEGNDEISSTATLTVETFSTAETTATSSSNTGFNIAGSSSGESVAGATSDVSAFGVGIRGGTSTLVIDQTDEDVITNEGEITVLTTVTAETDSLSTADSITFIGAAEGTAISDASANVLAAGIGIDGGADNDTITSKGAMVVQATADASVKSRSDVDSYATFGGASSMGVSDASASVLAEVTGISGGTGDDIISSNALVDVEAQSIGSVSSVSDIDAAVTFGGASSEAASNSSVIKKGTATGIDGGSGNDLIINHDTLSVKAIAAGAVKSDSSASAGSTFGSASSITTTSAALEGSVDTKGIIGGSGGDTITNLGRVDSIADAALFVENSSVATAKSSFIGSADARASSASTLQGKAFSLGVGSDDGNDVIDNSGVVNVRAIANATVESATVAIAESFFGSSYTEAVSSNYAAGVSAAAGITSGAGNDEISNTELVMVEAGGTVKMESDVYSSDGPASSDARTIALAHASGMNSGADNDSIANTGTVFIKANPRIVSSTRTFGIGGNVDGKVGILLEAGATGIAGGQGDDSINNEGNVLVYIGGPETDSTISAGATVGALTFVDSNRIGDDPEMMIGKWIRIAGDESPDLFRRIVDFDAQTGQATLNDALTYDLDSGATYTIYDFGDKAVDISNVAVTVGGRTRVDASTAALVQAKGIAGGAGADEIVNSGIIAVSASNLIKSVELTIGRNIVADTRIESAVSAVGIEGNDQSCVTDVSDGGTRQVADLSRKGEDPEAMVGKTVLFKTGAAADFVTDIEAFDPETGIFTLVDPLPGGGLMRGDIYTLGGGSDIIANLDKVDVAARSAIDASSWSIDFGPASIEGQGQTLASSAGMRSGQSDDFLQNHGDISARSVADVSSSDRVTVIFGGAEQNLSFEASSYSVGVETGAGADDFTNAEKSSVAAESVSNARVDGVTAVLFAKIVNSVDAIADSTAVGLDLGQGDNLAYSMGDILASSQSNVAATAVSDFELGETDADADAIAFSSATGVLAGSNENQVYSASLIQVNASTEATSFAQGSQVGNRDVVSEVTGGSAEDSNPSTFVDTSLVPQPGEQAEIIGEWVRFLSGENADENFFAQVVGFVSEDIVDPDSGDILVPAGTVTLSMDIPHPVYAEETDPDTGAIVTVADEYTFSAARNGTSASVSTANATGIDLRNSKAKVENTDILNVQAFAEATTTANTFGGVATAVAEARAVAQGIVTGNGDAVVINAGVVSVEAEALTSISGTGVTENVSAVATGVSTGSGDDTVWNSGSVITMEKTGAIVTAGNAIVTGAGDDTVILGNLSTTVGDVDLGDDNDILHLIGSPVVIGAILPGEDIDSVDSLIFEGLGYFANTLQGFDRATKQRSGTYMVENLPSLQRLEIFEGTLQTNSDYNFAEGGLFLSHIYSDSRHGKLQATGNVVLDGELQILRNAGVYLDGTKYNILEATSVAAENHFSHIVVPEPSTLLSFEVHQLSDVVEVEVLAKSFTTVATDKAHRSVARYLDDIMPSATGDLSDIIGELQILSAEEFSTAFSSLTPRVYEQSGRAALSAGGNYINSVHSHMNSFRSIASLGDELRQNKDEKRKPVLLASNGSLLGLGVLLDPDDSAGREKNLGVWIRGDGLWGNQEAKDGYLGYDYDSGGFSCGFDWSLNPQLLAGFSLGYAYTDIQGESGTSSGNVESTYLTAYGTYFAGKGYLEGMLSYGFQNYDNWRKITIGDIGREAASDHDGHSFSTFLRGGYHFDHRPWLISPYVSLQYVELSEEAFRETGAGDISLAVDSRSSDTLKSEIGARFQRIVELSSGVLVPELSLAWNHDFGIDDHAVIAGFAGASGATFTTESPDDEQNSLVIETGLSLFGKNGFTTRVQYAGKFRSSYSDHSVSGILRYEF